MYKQRYGLFRIDLTYIIVSITKGKPSYKTKLVSTQLNESF